MCIVTVGEEIAMVRGSAVRQNLFGRTVPGMSSQSGELADQPVSGHSKSTTAKVIGVSGELIITFGVLCLLFAIYQLWWTNVAAASQTSAARSEAQAFINGLDQPSWANGIPPQGTPFGLMYIPRLRDHVWATPIVQGVDRPQLAQGVGHYMQTAMPGQAGNVGIAGHRATNGEPFANFDQLRKGDKVYIVTSAGWFTYELQRDKIVDPSEVWTISPQPFPDDPLPSDHLITLTTCNPRWASTTRWIYWGVQIAQSPVEQPPAEVA